MEWKEIAANIGALFLREDGFFFLFLFWRSVLERRFACCRIRAEAGVMYVRVNMGRKRIDRISRSALVSVL